MNQCIVCNALTVKPNNEIASLAAIATVIKCTVDKIVTTLCKRHVVMLHIAIGGTVVDDAIKAASKPNEV